MALAVGFLYLFPIIYNNKILRPTIFFFGEVIFQLDIKTRNTMKGNSMSWKNVELARSFLDSVPKLSFLIIDANAIQSVSIRP